MSYTRTEQVSQLSEVQLELSADQYIRYLGGVALLTRPDATRDMHGFDAESESDRLDIVIAAEHLMYDGLRKIIFTVGGEGKPTAAYEDRHQLLLPRMLQVREHSFETQSQRIDRLHPFFAVFRPYPVTNEVTFKQLCHSRKSKLRTKDLMDSLEPEVRFREVVTADRTLSPS